MSADPILLNPGPVTLTDTVRSALTRGDWCHREPDFAELTRDVIAKLARVYATAGDFDAVMLTGSGTCAVEAMLCTFAPRDARTLVAVNGVYGERMAAMLAAHGRDVVPVTAPWECDIDLAAIERTLQDDPSVRCVVAVQHETTTGRLNDIPALARLCTQFRCELLLDAVSSFGAEDIRFDHWPLTALAATANKCLHGVAGICFVMARRDAFARHDPPGSVYLDARAYHRAQHGDGYSPFTPAVQVVFALQAALDEHRAAGGWQARRARYRELAARVRATLAGLGVDALLPEAECAAALTTYRLPAGIDYAALHARLKSRGFVIYAGQGRLVSDVFRIATMGHITDADAARLEQALTDSIAR